MASVSYKRIGHKGADALAPGNTLESFEAAVDEGVDVIEFDVLRDREGRLVVAHDYQDASTRRPLALTDALDAFCEAPLDKVDFDCDLKLAGREAELAGALAGHDVLDRAMVSTMEIESLVKLRKLEPDMHLGWTVPKTRRDWTRYRWAGPAVVTGLMAMRRRLPRTIAARAPELRVNAVWAYHRLVTPRLVEVAHEAGIELVAWTVDESERITQLAEMGVHGIVSNDPRLFKGDAPSPAQDEGKPEPGDAKEIAEELADEAEPEPESEPKAGAAKS
jgi:glycerophosphoryl diester phosphodiesterase